MPIIKKLISPIKNTHFAHYLWSFSPSNVLSHFTAEAPNNLEEIEINLLELESKGSLEDEVFDDLFNFETDDKRVEMLHSLNNFGITPDELIRITSDIMIILRDPELVAKYLGDLDLELGQKMSKAGIKFKDRDFPQYLIPGKGHFIAGPPPPGYIPRHKGRILNKILLQHEMAAGVNMEGYSARFVGFVNSEEANKVVADGRIFSEDEQVDNMILHGKSSHRFVFEVMRNAAARNELNLTLESGETLSQKRLLELFTTIHRHGDPQCNLWQIILDSNQDSVKLQKDSNGNVHTHDPALYSFSSKSAMTFKSLLTCFGADLKLPNLQHYLLDSHWKQVMKIAFEIKITATDPVIRDAPIEQIYDFFMKSLSADGVPEQSFFRSFFTKDVEAAAKNKKYLTEPGHEFIKIKNTHPNPVGKYRSWDDFFYKSKLNQKTAEPEIIREILPSKSPKQTFLSNLAQLFYRKKTLPESEATTKRTEDQKTPQAIKYKSNSKDGDSHTR